MNTIRILVYAGRVRFLTTKSWLWLLPYSRKEQISTCSALTGRPQGWECSSGARLLAGTQNPPAPASFNAHYYKNAEHNMLNSPLSFKESDTQIFNIISDMSVLQFLKIILQAKQNTWFISYCFVARQETRWDGSACKELKQLWPTMWTDALKMTN